MRRSAFADRRPISGLPGIDTKKLRISAVADMRWFCRERGRVSRMGSIGRYIFRTTLGAFLVICASVTALMWITQALRDIDLMTNQGQSIFVFIGITGLIIPLLVQIIAPIALMIAVAHVLNKLGNDSELIVMNAAGMPPWRFFRPFLAVAIVVSLLVAAISTYVSPWACASCALGDEVREDFVTNIVQPGRFTKLEANLTLHIRERRPNGQLLGIFIDDQRDPKERATILAEQGDIVKNGSRSVPRAGERQCAASPDRTARSRPRSVRQLRFRPVVDFERHAERQVLDARTISVGAVRSDLDRQAVCRPAGASPCRAARPDHGAPLSARLRGDDLRLSRRAAHNPSGPHDVAHGRDRRGRGATRAGFRRHDRRRERAVRSRASVSRLDRDLRAGIFRDLARHHHRTPGFRHQRDYRDHRAHRPAYRRPMGQSP